MRFSACLNTSHHGPSHPFKDAGVVADSPTGIHSAMVKSLFILNRSGIHKGFYVFPEDSNLARVETMQWVLLYLSVSRDRCY
jgi:hypothetical protein